jgi:hypothetical protein
MTALPHNQFYFVHISESSDIGDGKGGSLPSVHIWADGDDAKADILIGGFFQTMKILVEEMRKDGRSQFALEASCEKRQRVFSKYAKRMGASIIDTVDFFGDSAQIIKLK